MTGLEQTFYIMAIIYMSVMFVIMVAAIVAILAIKAKINDMHRMVEEKLHAVSNIFHAGQEVINKVKGVVGK